MAKLLTGIFPTRLGANCAIEDLLRHDFAPDDISLLKTETARGPEFIVEESTKAPEGLACGSAIGGIIGAVVFAMTSVGMIAMPGANMYASGWYLSMLVGFGLGSLIGGLIGGLVGLALPEHEAELFRGDVHKGGVLLGVYVDDDKKSKEAFSLMEAGGAEHLKVVPARPEVVRLEKVS
ncbi:MAG TPA: hypothetical protein V6C72_04205 [Chroococcales cyanobacterium]